MTLMVYIFPESQSMYSIYAHLKVVSNVCLTSSKSWHSREIPYNVYFIKKKNFKRISVMNISSTISN